MKTNEQDLAMDDFNRAIILKPDYRQALANRALAVKIREEAR